MALWHDLGLSHGLAIATLNGSGFAGPNIFAPCGTPGAQRTPCRLPSFPEIGKPTLLLLLLHKLHRPPGEEVERVAVGVLVADIERRVLVSYQRAFLDQVFQGVVVTLGADIAYV